jgi:hypothetical protein
MLNLSVNISLKRKPWKEADWLKCWEYAGHDPPYVRRVEDRLDSTRLGDNRCAHTVRPALAAASRKKCRVGTNTQALVDWQNLLFEYTEITDHHLHNRRRKCLSRNSISHSDLTVTGIFITACASSAAYTYILLATVAIQTKTCLDLSNTLCRAASVASTEA